MKNSPQPQSPVGEKEHTHEYRFRNFGDNYESDKTSWVAKYYCVFCLDIKMTKP